jgi:hypothetical protein
MLSDHVITPILAIAIDDINNTYNGAVNAISEALPDIKESAILQSIDDASQWFLSDINDKSSRIFIPITDKLLPIHYTSGDVNSGKNVGRDGDGLPQISQGGNTVSLKFEIKNSLSTLSTISDILYSIVAKNAIQTSTQPRVSFYGGSICIFNAYLVGVSRSMVSETDQEVVSLTLEMAGKRPPNEKIADKKPVDPFLESTIEDPSVLSDDNGIAEVAALGDAYQWYLLSTQADFLDQPVPDFTATTTIRNKNYNVLRTWNYSTTGLRQMVGFRYNNKYLTMEMDQAEIISEDQQFSIAAFDGGFYMGFLI